MEISPSSLEKFSWIKNIEFFGSIERRGLVKTLKIIYFTLEDYFFDIKHGTDTAGCIQLTDLEIDSENQNRGVRYEPTKTRPFRKLLTILKIPADNVFVDFGCGKGKVLMLALEYGFKNVVGVEFSRKLCNDANRNLEIYQKKESIIYNFEVIESDVADVQLKDNETVFFFFNPFDNFVMDKILKNISSSLKRKDRKIWLIYHNSVHAGAFESYKYFLNKSIYNFGGSEFEFLVYQN